MKRHMCSFNAGAMVALATLLAGACAPVSEEASQTRQAVLGTNGLTVVVLGQTCPSSAPSGTTCQTTTGSSSSYLTWRIFSSAVPTSSGQTVTLSGIGYVRRRSDASIDFNTLVEDWSWASQLNSNGSCSTIIWNAFPWEVSAPDHSYYSVGIFDGTSGTALRVQSYQSPGWTRMRTTTRTVGSPPFSYQVCDLNIRDADERTIPLTNWQTYLNGVIN